MLILPKIVRVVERVLQKHIAKRPVADERGSFVLPFPETSVILARTEAHGVAHVKPGRRSTVSPFLLSNTVRYMVAEKMV